MTQNYRIYLDVCCLNRPLDDSSQERIRLEAEAVLLIYKKCRLEECVLISSEAIEAEVAQTPNSTRVEQIMLALAINKQKIIIDQTVKKRAAGLIQLGFKPFDALHIASAEAGGADVMLTTDDRLLRKAAQYRHQLNVSVNNPANWLIEIHQTTRKTENDDTNRN